MVADGMLTRKRYREVPPRVDYELTERSRELAPVLGQLARWGYEWAWSPPRAHERIDLGAIFRLIPGLVGEDNALSGTVELTVSDGRGEAPAVYRVTLRSGGAEISEGPDGGGDARLAGTMAAWVRALSPIADREGLTVAGDAQLAGRVLDLLSLGRGRQATDAGAETATA